MFRLYGYRDFTGNRSERGERGYLGESILGPLGSNANLPPWASFQQSDVGLSNFGGTLVANQISNLRTQVALPSWVLPSQPTVSRTNFGGTIPYSRVADLPVQVILPEWVNQSLTRRYTDIQLRGIDRLYKIVNTPLLAALPTWSSSLL